MSGRIFRWILRFVALWLAFQLGRATAPMVAIVSYTDAEGHTTTVYVPARDVPSVPIPPR